MPPLVGASVMFFIPKVTSRAEEGGTHAEVFASISHWSLNEGPPVGKKCKGRTSLILLNICDLK